MKLAYVVVAMVAVLLVGLQVAAGRVPRDYMAVARDYDEATWRHHEEQLAERGLVADDGTLTAAGRELT